MRTEEHRMTTRRLRPPAGAAGRPRTLSRRAAAGPLAGGLAGALAALAGPRGAAAEEWCEHDPVVQARDARGRPLTVHVYVGVPAADRKLAPRARATGTVEGGALVLEVAGPPTPFTVRGHVTQTGQAMPASGPYPPGATVRLAYLLENR
jgi:hypothetical protein